MFTVKLHNQHLFFSCIERELKPQGKLALTVVKATTLKYMEMIGKSDPNVAVHILPLFKYKTNVLDNNLNPFWNEKFELIAEDKETQSLILEVSLLILCLLFMLLSSASFCGICCDIFYFINMCPSIMLITF